MGDAEAISQVFQRIANWAASKPFVAAVYIFGSRAQDTERDNSDLDIAVELTVADATEALAIYMNEKEMWCQELQELSRWPVDLDLYHKEAAPNVFGYVSSGGMQIWIKPRAK
jgi:predicted nucleotidyltransferase